MDLPENKPASRARSVAIAIALVISVAIVLKEGFHIPWRVWGWVDLGQPWRNGWQFPTESLIALVAAAGVCFAISGIGFWIIRKMQPRAGFTLCERSTLAPLVGAIPVSLATLGIGLAGFARLYQLNIFLSIMVILAVPGWFGWLREWQKRPRGARGVNWFLIALAVFVFAIAIPYALSPVVESDALRYHVAAPAQWLRAGRIHYLPNQAFSNFPFLGEMLFMLAMSAGGYEASQPIHLFMLALSMVLIAMLARRCMRWRGVRPHGPYACAAAVAFALVPSVPVIAAWGFIDLFVTAYFIGFALAGGAMLGHSGRGRALILGFMIAGGLSTKYTMLPLMGALCGAWWVINLRFTIDDLRFKTQSITQPPQSSIVNRQSSILWGSLCPAFIAGILGLLLASPWFVRNVAWTGNPVYPLAVHVFDGGDWTPANDAFYKAKAAEKGFKIPGLPRAVAAPLELLATPYTATYYPDLFESHLLGCIPLIALVWVLAGLFSRSGRRAKAARCWIAVVLAGSWVFWFATYQSVRMLIPTVGVLLAWTAAVAAGWGRSSRTIRIGLKTIAAVSMLFSASIYALLMLVPNGRGNSYADALATGLGFESRKGYLTRRVAYYASAQWLAQHAAPGEKALLIGEHRPLYFDLPVHMSDWFNTTQPFAYIQDSKDNSDMLDSLLEHNVHYVFYNQSELNKYYDLYILTRYAPNLIRRFEELVPVHDSIRHDPRLQELDARGQPPDAMMIYRILPR